MTREEAIKVLNMVEAYGLADEAKKVAIEALKQEPRKGKWVGLDECSVCGKQAYDFIEGYIDGVEYLPNFCPNCGAKMKGQEE